MSPDKNDIRQYVDISTKDWLKLLENRRMITTKDLDLLTLVYYRPHHMARAGELAEWLEQKAPGSINLQVVRMSKRIASHLRVTVPLRESGEKKWWHIPFTGSSTSEGFYWILRVELKEAMAILEKNKQLPKKPFF